MRYLDNIKKSFSEVYSPSYIFLSVFVALSIFLFNVLIINYELVLNNFNLVLIFSLVRGAVDNMLISSFFILIIVSILAGILVSLLVYKMKRSMELNKSYGVAGGGIFLGVLAPACTSCGLGLLALFGYGGLLAFLPFRGLELGVIAVVLLGVGIVSVSNGIAEKTC